VLLLDLDKFKAVNDRLGHQAGDALLCEVAGRLKAAIREVDIAARIGGDEFALIIMPGRDALQEGAATLATRLVDVVSAPYRIEGQSVVIGCSIGVALAPVHGERSDELLRNADLALYKSKNGGRNCFHIYGDEFKLEADNRNALENDLREAIWREEFELFYQPVIDLGSGAVTAVEALVRWRHPVKGLILPDQFIPLAEQTGLIVQMGEWAMVRACRDAMLMPPHIKVAVNLSPVQFAKSNLVEAAIFALVDSQLPPERLELEVTEGVLLQETEQNLEILRQLKNLGVSIALDDFGVGYSSLGYLTSFPFGKVKIDRSFVKRLEKPESKAVISSIVQLSRSLNLVTAAEGIETDSQLAEIQALGVDLGQGFLFGRAEPLADLDFSVVRAMARTRAA
jgi:diguanylate cyclase (GGDEF)-like protein